MVLYYQLLNLSCHTHVKHVKNMQLLNYVLLTLCDLWIIFMFTYNLCTFLSIFQILAGCWSHNNVLKRIKKDTWIVKRKWLGVMGLTYANIWIRSQWKKECNALSDNTTTLYTLEFLLGLGIMNPDVECFCFVFFQDYFCTLMSKIAFTN